MAISPKKQVTEAWLLAFNTAEGQMTSPCQQEVLHGGGWERAAQRVTWACPGKEVNL